MGDELDDLAERLVDEIRGYESCLIAFSGGVDSAVVLRAAREALGALAVAGLGISPSVSGAARQQAFALAAEIGVPLEQVETSELQRPDYRSNDGLRCRACKETLYGALQPVAQRLRLKHIASGTNAGDLGDFRPGLAAGQAAGIRTPLADLGITKSQVRQLARRWGLSVAEAPAGPCLASRVAYGEPVSAEVLARLEAAEAWMAGHSFTVFRVRYHPGDHARIEVPVSELGRFMDDSFRQDLIERFRVLGFRFVSLDLEGFASGRLNRLVTLSVISQDPTNHGVPE
jgi:uncharacterized protein